MGSVDLVTKLLALRWRNLGSISGTSKRFITSKVSKPATGLTQSLIQWEPDPLFPTIKQLESEYEYPPPSTTEVKNDRDIAPFPHMPLRRTQVL